MSNITTGKTTEEHLVPDYESYFDLLNMDPYFIDKADEVVRSYDYEEYEWLYQTHVYYLVDLMTRDIVRYTPEDLKILRDTIVIKILPWYAEKFDSNYYRALLALVFSENEKCINYLRKYFAQFGEKNKDYAIDEFFIGDNFLQVFKNAYPGFWKDLAEILEKNNCVDYMPQLLRSIELFYESEDNEEIRTALIDVGRKMPYGLIVNELLGINYEEDNMWNNALSYYELVPEVEILRLESLFFRTAYAASKVKKTLKAVEYYKKCLEINPSGTFSRNNMAYELYKLKKYSEAKQVFEEALADKDCFKQEIPYLSRNYIKVLIAMHKYQEAQDFINNSKVRISKSLKDRVAALLDKNGSKDSADADITEDIEEDITEYAEDGDQEDFEPKKKDTFGKKKHQFSSEKILEDELESRINSGLEVFGLKLKMYDHDDDRYGRQYVIPIGRLDLLCEDDNGDLFIIELKKDSGYDDPFKQTVEYVDWFETNFVKKGQKVTGIICLNNPSKQLIKKVKAEPRIRLFEYAITYKEIKF